MVLYSVTFSVKIKHVEIKILYFSCYLYIKLKYFIEKVHNNIYILGNITITELHRIARRGLRVLDVPYI